MVRGTGHRTRLPVDLDRRRLRPVSRTSLATAVICRALNEAAARYLLIGGFAVIAHGGVRTTKDIGLLVDASPENVARVKQALRILEDRAVDQIADTDLARYTVVRWLTRSSSI